MKYEIAYLKNNQIISGGVAADIRTVARWIEDAMEMDPGTTYFAIPANEDAVPIRQVEIPDDDL